MARVDTVLPSRPIDARMPAPAERSAAGRERGSASRTSTTRSADVDLSQAARTLEGQRKLLRGLLAGVEEQVPAGGDLFESSGRSAYLAQISNPTDLSSEATAERILGGITGYIFGAFQLSREELDADDVEEFAAQAREGLDRGLREAGDILAALDQLRGGTDGRDPGAVESDRAENLPAIRDHVLAGLDRFVEAQREKLAGA